MTTHGHGATTTAALLRSVAVALFVSAAAFGAAAAQGAAEGYGWPVKPFDRQHPVRGQFGDPRTVFQAPPTTEGVLTSGGKFSFHFGVDISAPDGTKVYPVVSGSVTQVARDWVGVDAGGGRSFQYWHIDPSVSVGEAVEARRTVLGTILRGQQHVHFSELRSRRPVNPLRAGHLTPYVDTTAPDVAAISFRAEDRGPDLMPNFLRGRVQMVVEAYDAPSLPVPGEWNGMPVSPTTLTWRIQRLGGRPVVRETVAANFSTTIPENGSFWSYYARGTFQNMSVFAKHYSYRQPGRFLFKLTRTPFDTRTIPDGVYDLVVTAVDIRGNRVSLSRRFTVHNRPGWVGP